jgi:cell wall-associated NlpC family hydrolase
MKRTLAVFICAALFFSVLASSPMGASAAEDPAVSPAPPSPAAPADPNITPAPPPPSPSNIQPPSPAVSTISSPLLSDIQITAGTLNRTFRKSCYRYTLKLDEATESTTITPVRLDRGAAMTIDNEAIESKAITVVKGRSVNVRITVTTQSVPSKSRTYIIKVIRAKSTVNDLASLTTSAGALEPAFDPAVLQYNLNLDEYTFKVKLSAAKLDPLSTLRMDGRRTTGRTYTLAQGETQTAVISVRSQAGATKTYTVCITRATGTITDKAAALIEFAKTNLGKPYVSGGKGPDCFDCSGFVYYCLNSTGLKINYMTSHVWPSSAWTNVASPGEMKPGDILCFKGHVAIYLGDNKMIDASSSHGGIRITGCVSPYWTTSFICAKRVFIPEIPAQ